MMKQITKSLRNDEFRQLIRDDMDFSQPMHHKSREKQRKITDGMTQMMINILNWSERHSRYEDIWNAVRFSRDFQRQICSSDQQSVQQVMQSNGFVIDSHYIPPVGGRAGETKAIFVSKEKIVRAGNWIKKKYLQQTQKIEHQGFNVDWTQTFDFGDGVQIPSRIRIDAAVLQEFCEEKFNEDEKLHADWHLAVMLISAMENEGWMEQNYWVSPLGRLFGRGISSLQYCPKELLRRILPKTCSVLDVNTAALVILHQEHQRLVPCRSSFPHLEEFIAEKTRIRKEIADSLGVAIDQVKKAFTAIGFGIKRTTSSYPVRDPLGGGIQYEESTLTKNFGSRQTAEQFLENEFVKEYWNEYSRLGAELTKEVRKQNPAWMEELKRTLEIPKHQILPKKTILFYLFQQSEAGILKSICRQVGADLVLPKHDAAVILKRYEPQEVFRIEQGILEDTGFQVKLSSEPV